MAEFINKADISDAMIERPVTFSIKEKNYSVYPPTLGKIQLTSRLIESLGIDKVGLSMQSVYVKLFTVAKTKRDICLRIIAYSTLPGSDCLDENKVLRRLQELSIVDEEDIATLLVAILTSDKSGAIMKYYGIDKESERLTRVLKVKKDSKNSLRFAGKSIWGTMIDAACERYGWTYQYVLWGISYCNLQLLLADQVKTVFLTDEERKSIHVSNDSTVVRADNATELKDFIKTQNWK